MVVTISMKNDDDSSSIIIIITIIIITITGPFLSQLDAVVADGDMGDTVRSPPSSLPHPHNITYSSLSVT